MAEDRPPRIEILLFGGPIVRVGDVEVRKFPTQYAAALLTLLALRPNHHYDRDELARALWPDEEPDATRPRLRENLYQLRRLIPGGGDLIQSSRQAIWLTNGDSLFVDVLEFDRLYDSARETEEPALKQALLTEALALYTAPIAPSLDGAALQAQRDQYEERAAECRKLQDKPVTSRPSEWQYATPLLAAAVLLLVLLMVLRPWSRLRAEGPPLTADQRVEVVEGLHGKPGHERERAEQCVALAEEAWKSWYGRDEQIWLYRLRHVKSDLRASVAWLTEHNPDRAVQISGALMRYWYLDQMQGDAARFLERALASGSKTATGYRARALVGRSLTFLGGTDEERRRGLDCASEALAIFQRTGDRWGQGHALRHMGLLDWTFRRREQATRDYTLAMSRFREVQGPTGVSGVACTIYCANMMGPILPTTFTATQAGEARCFHQGKQSLEALRLFQQVDNDWGIRECFNGLVSQLSSIPLNDQTRAFLQAVQTECRKHARWQEAKSDFEEMKSAWRHCIYVSLRLRDWPTVVEGVGRLAFLSHGPSADTLWGAYQANIGLLPKPPFMAPDRTGHRYDKDPTKATAFSRGKRMTLPQIAQFALQSPL